ncbi:Ig-like domain-containing protein [Chromatium okenii]|uniref:beta strand repeat-containing protein n=1 Tax=Chromatium okenii TaxID=61644 RepID=UPI0026EE4C83|nr:Ig-like domain-containing protein [Chromatium okenii]MBV5309939.1 Ig-like domain-containing protein [Chromatium okenii]
MASTISKMTTAQVAALTTKQIAGLQSTDVAALTAAMIDAMDLNTTDGQFEAFKPTQITSLSNLAVAALSSTQLNQLTTATFAALSKTQVAAISTAAISGIDVTHIKALSSLQITGLTINEIAHLTTAQISQLSTAAVAALSSTQIGAFAIPVDKSSGADITGTIAALTPTQFAALASSALPGLLREDIITKDATTGWLGVTTAQLNALTSKQVPGLATDDFGYFNSAQINALNTAAFSQLTKTQISKIDPTQISGIDTNHIGAITTAQVSGLSTGELSAAQLASLSSEVVAVLTSAQLGALANGVIKGFSADQFASLASSALPGLDTADIASLNDNSVISNTLLGALTSKQTPGLATADIKELSAAQINLLDPDAFAALSKTQVGAIAINQIKGINVDHIAALTSAQIPGLLTAAIAALNDGTITGQIAALSSAAIAAMSADQVDALGADGVAALTADQFAALPSKALAGLTAEDVIAYADTGFTSSLPDSTAPVLVGSNPRDGSTTFAPNGNIVLTFSEDVELGMGNIMIDGSASDIDIPVVGGSALASITVNGNTVTINPASDLATTQTYDLSIDATAIYDKAGNAYAGIPDIDTATLNFELMPVLSTAAASGGTPANFLTGANTSFPIANNIALTFSENMKAGTGNIIVSSADGSDVRTIPVGSSQVTFGAGALATDKVTINPTADLLPGTTYTVQMASGVLTANDATVTPYAGVSDTTTLDFVTTADPTGPTATMYAGVAANTAVNANIVLTMDEPVTAVAGKKVEVWLDDVTDSLIESFDATDPEISIAGKIVTINPTSDFTNAKVYFVKVEAGAFTDASSNGNLAFTTTSSPSVTLAADGAAPTLATSVVGASVSPLDNSTQIDETGNLVLTFDDAVLSGAGNIIFRSADGSDVRTIDVTSSQVTFDTATKKVTIDPGANLLANTLYSVQVDSGALIDNYNHAYAGFTDPTYMNFTITDVVPYIVKSSPVNNSGVTATPVALDSNIVLTFNEPVLANTAGIAITLTPKVDGTAVVASTVSFNSNSSQVTIVGNVVTINPSSDLIPNATYELTAVAAAFKDIDPGASGLNAVLDSAAIAAGTVAFKTTDTFAPELTYINDKAAGFAIKNAAADNDIVLTFSEGVTRGSGDIIIAPYAPLLPNDPVLRFAITDTTQVTIDATKKIVTINPTDGTALAAAAAEYSVIIDDTVILDAAGNPAPNLTSITTNTTGGVIVVGGSVTGQFTSIAAAGSDLKLQFSEAIKAGSGNIIVSNGAGDTHIIPVTDTTQVIFDTSNSSIVTINPAKDLVAGDAYSITMGSGVITDLQGNAYDAPTVTDWGLSPSRISLISAAQMPGLSAEVITAMSPAQVSGLSLDAVAAMSSAQITALDPYDVAAMSIDQFAAIGSAAIAGLEASDITALASIPGATDRIAALTAAQAPKLSEEVMAALNTVQVPALTVDTVAALSSVQLGAMTPTAIGSMTFDQFAALNSAALASLDATDIDALKASNTGQIAAITVDQVAKLSTDAIASLNSIQISALAADTFAALSTAQIAAIDNSAVYGITISQLEALTCAHQNLTEAQVLLLNSAQLQALNFATPLVLDLNGDNVIDTTAAKDGVVFDLAGDGSAAKVGWVAPSDGLLVLDVNGDGVINDGTELFGSGTRLADGSTAADGFIALAALNSNNKDASEGVIDAQDAAFAQLQVWQDANQDGVTDAGELLSLAELNIASLSLDANRDTREMNNGNILDMYAEYTTTDGATHQLVDVLLAGVIEFDLAA